jgi:hypothetical protein
MKVSHRFVALLLILLVVLIIGIFVILMSIVESQKPIIDYFPPNPKMRLTNQSLETGIHGTETAKAYTPVNYPITKVRGLSPTLGHALPSPDVWPID